LTIDKLDNLVAEIPTKAAMLAEAFWPGEVAYETKTTTTSPIHY
jgi:tRNA A37 threonylcarbamoyladenosine synthetase subunit TsaC/SUA5/YrdC